MLSFSVKHDGVVERVEHRSDLSKDLPNTVEDFRAIAEYARATGTRIVFVG